MARPHLRILTVAAGLTAGAVAPPVVGAQATVSGTVFDSTARVMLAGALVQLLRAEDPAAAVAHSARTDTAGRFVVTGVGAGRYLGGFLHPVLDSLDVELPPRPLDVAPGAGTVRLMLAVPSAATIGAALCGPTARSDSTGTVFGRLYDAETLRPVTDGSVSVQWLEFTIGPAGARERRPEVRAQVGEGGRFIFCNVPGESVVGLRAARGTDTTGAVQLPLPARGAARRDLFVGRVAASTAEVDTLTLGDSSRAAVRRVVRRGTARLAGTVRNKDGRPIKGARLRVAESGVEATTDDDGRFLLSEAPGGTQRLEVRAIGYYPEERAVDLIAGRPTSVDLTLATLRSVLDTVRVSASRVYSFDTHGFERRRQARATGYFFDQRDVERLRPNNVTQLLNRVQGVSFASNGFDSAILMRDFFTGDFCEPVVFIDGIRMTQLSARDIDMWVRPEELAGMEVYTRSEQAPPEFTTPEGCGALVLWTRRPTRQPRR
ncbi:MAG: Plug and carboxypeptidase regulatory-like domain-containing protein [Gemmatimonadota bacterium]|nr:Plug and carboxypeptidase regulatory-like domain-containing protein [Gemmatimonadota bacterium]